MRLSPGRALCAVAATATLMALLASCSPADEDGPDTAGSAPPPSTAAPSPASAPPSAGAVPSPSPAPSDPAPTARLRLLAGDVAVVVTGTWTDATAPEPGTAGAARTLTVPSGALPVTISSVDGRFVRHTDGSVGVLHGPDDVPVGGLSAPDGPAAYRQLDARHLELVPAGDGAETSARAPVRTVLGTTGLVGTLWGEREGGRSLAVDATSWARSAGTAGVELVWAELVAADPDVDTATMRDQLVCHALGAPDKDTWNLEPWRPDVGLVAVLAARCNPTDGA